MNRNELQAMFPAVLDGSCPLGIFADACDDCDLESFLVNRIRQLRVIVTERPGPIVRDMLLGVTVFKVGLDDEPLMNEWMAMVSDMASEQLLQDTERDAQLACRKLAVRWVKECLGIKDVKCKRCKGTGKEQHSGGKNCPRCGGDGFIRTLKEETVTL